MNDLDLITLFQQITARWPKFPVPEREAFQDWHEALAEMSYEAGLWAVKDQLKHNRFPPHLADIISRAANCPYNQGKEWIEQDHHGYPGIYIECVEAPKRYPGRLGLRKPLAYNAYARLPPRPNMEAFAEEWARRNQELYGGTWIVGYEERTNHGVQMD